ncbi:MAG: polysaccharide pyruvyl transferase family protein [Methylobacter sp.]
MIEFIKRIKTSISTFKWKLELRCRIGFSGGRPKLFYLMGVYDTFSNLGDQAQAAAIQIWLKQHLHLPIIELKTGQIGACLPLLKKLIRKQDIVFLHSGGNFGDDWPCTQAVRESIIAELTSNKVIQLPQTIFYGNTDSGRIAVRHSQQIINAHPNLLIFGRDLRSAKIAANLFNGATVLARPDMVLSLQDKVEKALAKVINKRTQRIRRVLLIMRNDKEGVYDAESKRELEKILVLSGYRAMLWDTDVEDTFKDRAKFKVVCKYLKFIAGFDAVITDRYHGLIFSVLVKRPCIVLKTHNHKLTSAFDWFDQVNYVKRIDSADDVIATLNGFENLTEYVSPRWNELHFDPMAAEVKDFCQTEYLKRIEEVRYV